MDALIDGDNTDDDDDDDGSSRPYPYVRLASHSEFSTHGSPYVSVDLDSR